jgi:hypothetical protein
LSTPEFTTCGTGADPSNNAFWSQNAFAVWGFCAIDQQQGHHRPSTRRLTAAEVGVAGYNHADSPSQAHGTVLLAVNGDANASRSMALSITVSTIFSGSA